MKTEYVRVKYDLAKEHVSMGARGKVISSNDKTTLVEFGTRSIILPNEALDNWEMCHQCEMLRINGVVTHESGCPDAWKDEIRECKECGSKFFPENRNQLCCDHSCTVSYHNLSCDCEVCREPIEDEPLEEIIPNP
jgi:hypothetical protein